MAASVLALALTLALELNHVAAQNKSGTETAVLAGGCFWTMQAVFDKVPGVITTEVGFTGGRTERPTYAQVVAGGTGHLEAVRIEFNPGVVSFAQLLDVYWRNIDPTRTDEQFCDIGRAYNPTVFYIGEAQQRAALASKAAVEKSKPFSASIRTPIIAAPTFWPAEDEQQQFYRREPERYAAYVRGCGRAERLERLWGPATTRPKTETGSRSTQ